MPEQPAPDDRFIQLKASAGSGKTYALTRRFLTLLKGAGQSRASLACGRAATGYGWPEILAVTFTNKAAAEMKDRVLGSLKDRALDLEQGRTGPAEGWDPALASRWLDVLLQDMGALNIRTIDSLLTLLVRLSALSLNLPPDFEPVFDLEETFTRLFDQLVEQAQAGAGPEHEALADCCQALLWVEGSKGFQTGRKLKDRLKQALEKAVASPSPFLCDPAPLRQRLTALFNGLKQATRAMEDRLRDLGAEPLKHFSNRLAFCRDVELYTSLDNSIYDSKPGLADCLPKKSKGLVTPGAETDYAAFKQAVVAFKNLGPVLRKAETLTRLSSLCTLLMKSLGGYQLEHGQVHNSRFPHYAAQVLKDAAGVSEAFCRMGARLSHLLIDEFQDTSREQWEAMAPLGLECLSKGGSLFYVGDVKQAIYGWRGGDSSLFNEAAKEPDLAAVAGDAREQTLPNNWRSAPRIVEFNNRVFNGLADPAKAEAVARALLSDAPVQYVQILARTLNANFAQAEQQTPQGLAGGPQGLVRLYDLKAENKDALHLATRDLLREILLDDVLQRRSVGDVALLVRSNEQASIAAQWLVDWSVPVATENSLLLGQHPLIKQMAAFLAFLDYPPNDIALWDGLTAGSMLPGDRGFTLDSLHDWLAGKERGTLYLAFRRDFPEAWERYIEPLYRRSGLMSAYDMVRDMVERFDLLRRHPRDELFIRRFMETAYRAEEKGARSLSAFLALWQESGAEEKTPLPEHLDAVRILTVHKAKGLEFPVVITPFSLFTKPRSGEAQAVPPQHLLGDQWPGSDPILAPLVKGLGQPYFEQQVPNLAEQLNLLYVAWTRPREELHGVIGQTSREGPGRREAMALLLGNQDPAGKAHGFILGEAPTDQGPSAGGGNADAEPESPIDEAEPRPRDTADPMAWLPKLRIHRNAVEAPAFDGRRRGALAHACLESFVGLAPGMEDQERKKRIERVVRNACSLEPGLDQARRDDLIRELKAMLDWVLAEPRLAACLEHGRAEASFLDQDGQTRRADLLAVDEQAVTVVEYKTGGPEPGHELQLRDYLGLVRDSGLAQGRKTTGLLVYLDQQRIVEHGMETGGEA